MLIPSTYIGALLLTILTMICWGSWANTMKAAGPKWRFELFYFDYSFGVLLAAIIGGFTFGMIEGKTQPDNGMGMNLIENYYVAANLRMVYAFAGGVIFNLANMLLVAAISIAGMSVAFPIGIGLALVIGTAWSFLINPQGNPLLLFGGSLILLIAIVVCAMAYRNHLRRTGAPVAPPPPPPPTQTPSIPSQAGFRVAPPSPKVAAARAAKPTGILGISLALMSGVLMGSFSPLVEMSRQSDLPAGPYLGALIFSIAVVLSTPFYNLFFMNMPVQGAALGIREYFKGTKRMHLLGILGGMIWCAGALSNFVAATTPKAVNVGPAVSYAIGQGATLVSTLWGLYYWKEFKGANSKTNSMLFVMIALFVIGLLMIAGAPLVKR